MEGYYGAGIYISKSEQVQRVYLWRMYGTTGQPWKESAPSISLWTDTHVPELSVVVEGPEIFFSSVLGREPKLSVMSEAGSGAFAIPSTRRLSELHTCIHGIMLLLHFVFQHGFECVFVPLPGFV